MGKSRKRLPPIDVAGLAPRWLRKVPSRVLFGNDRRQPVDVWCLDHGFQRPTLLHVAAERQRRQRQREALVVDAQRPRGGL